MAFRVFAGLGNPGPRYANTRHNIGFDILDRWALEAGVSFSEDKRGPADVARDGDLLLLKPLTYMNESGVAIRAWMDWLKISPADVLVILDDIALVLGQVRLRQRGSSGGHNGLRSIEAHLGTSDYARLRCGVGPVPPLWNQRDFVLGKFEASEQEALDTLRADSLGALRSCQSEGIEVAMNKFNRRLKAIDPAS